LFSQHFPGSLDHLELYAVVPSKAAGPNQVLQLPPSDFNDSGQATSITIVVSIVPVTFFAPPMLVFVPPTMMLAPATLARFMQFAAFVIGLPAAPSVAFDGLVEFVLGVPDSPLAALKAIGMRARRQGE
jgi:hypothetical protein